VNSEKDWLCVGKGPAFGHEKNGFRATSERKNLGRSKGPEMGWSGARGVNHVHFAGKF
jgi:hypothetical protein